MRRQQIIMPLAIVMSLLIPTTTLAFESSADERSVLREGKTVSGSYYAAGTNVSVFGSVKGDVICAARTVTISGPVSGDVICAAQTVTISGPVEGDVRIAAQTVNIKGRIGKNSSILAQNLTIDTAASLAGDLMSQVQDLTLNGPIAGEAYGSAENITLNSSVSGRVQYTASHLRLGSGARLGSGLAYTSHTDAEIARGAVIVGKNQRTTPKDSSKHEATASDRIASWLVSLGSALSIGLLGVWYLPKLVPAAAATIRRRPGMVMIAGLTVLVLTPVVGIMLLISIIGIPAGVITLLLWGIALYLSQILAAAALGVYLERRLRGKDQAERPYLAAVIGIVVAWIIFAVPVIGGLAKILAVLFGLGIIGKLIRDHIDHEDTSAQSQLPLGS